MLNSTANGQPWRDTVVSIVRNARETETTDISLDAALENIRNGRWAKPVAKIRERYVEAFKQAEKDGEADPHRAAKDAIAPLKLKLPGVTFSGRFKIREGNELDTHSGFICADIDKTPPEDCERLIEQFKSDAHVQAAFRSPSGFGLKVLFAILPDAGKHAQSFLAVERHIESVYARAIDGQAKEPVRLCFVSNDPNIFIRQDRAQVLEPVEPEPEPEPKGGKRMQIIRALARETNTSLYHLHEMNNTLVLNHGFVVEMMTRLYNLVFEQDEGTSRIYGSLGTWAQQHCDVARKMIRDELSGLSRILAEPKLFMKINSSILNSLVSHLQVVVGVRGVFDKHHGMLHAKNGMFRIHSNGEIQRFDFSPAYFSRNVIPINYNPDAKCPKFEAFLDHAISQEDKRLFLKWAGNLLLPGNPAQRMMILIGKPLRGKTVLATIIEMIIGAANVAALRPHLLQERFELSGFIGKILLTGKDRDQNFLNHQSAFVVKSLIGGDLLEAEIKGGNQRYSLKGNFNVLITMNERPVIRTHGENDAGAWLRRLLPIEFNGPEIQQRIGNFAETLFKEEAEGILALLAEGYIEFLKDLEVIGDYRLTPTQQSRIDVIVAESRSIFHFAKACIYRKEGSDVTVSELVKAYSDYCKSREWTPAAEQTFLTKIKNLMLELYGAARSNDIEREGVKTVRGYRNLAISEQSEDFDFS
jgi:P4 family phage/plasmid primase-like protien